MYSFYWAFFASYPLVYRGIYGFSLTGEGLACQSFLLPPPLNLTDTPLMRLILAVLSCAVGCIVPTIIYIVYQRVYMLPRCRRLGSVVNEERLEPALISAVIAPIGLFIFAWTARADVHWIGTSIGASLFSAANFFTLQVS